MPFIERSDSGDITALHAQPIAGHDEFLPSHHPEVLAFLDRSSPVQAFANLDMDLIRVIEDVVDTLINKGLLRLTDLPIEAQRKLMDRKGTRQRLRGGLRLLADDDVL
ncbi:MAG: hypothetical protein HGA47_01640 [Zoogloea sp.]|nr:hypothetical protein [Zoogloea sp.]